MTPLEMVTNADIWDIVILDFDSHLSLNFTEYLHVLKKYQAHRLAHHLA
jgi:hypothetical protein